ncbi:MAG: Hsp70 family protein, partial [Clostridia bacterium]|nr:Hsp70 family protein [Clostridia bacterium]
ANGIVNVSAVDKGTGREQHITITSNTNMSKEDVERAVQEAEQYAAEDKKNRENVETRNSADQAVYQCEQALGELGDKIDAADRDSVQAKIDALKETLKGEDYEAIKAAQEELMKVFYEVSAKVYQANAPEGAAPGTDGAPNADGYYDGDIN